MEIIDLISRPTTPTKPIELFYCLQTKSIPYHYDTTHSVPSFCKCKVPVKANYERITRLTQYPIDGKMYDLIELVKEAGNKTIWLGHWNDGWDLKMR